ncbi:MAG: imidazolonepropionase [Gammaproteobacteria bacterium]|nr:imidazolonepropionase [Gammaproteobacteria bacterium]MYF03036.1 imidazolonepropionase [Gammaproteobacteria bacterium]MYI77929.1 imidazolonepropionase [Gammaproteobacteria bacterium]
MQTWDQLFLDVNIATMCSGSTPYGAISNGALAILDKRIAWVGPESGLPSYDAKTVHRLDGRWLTPALIDCHTHLVFGGDRAMEFEQRLNGVTYEEISRAGGGIRSTVRSTRNASQSELLESAIDRVATLMREGVATVEVKSGYGLDRTTEITMLEVAKELEQNCSASIVKTFLGAHAIPEEFQYDTDSYIDFVIDEVLPEAFERQLVDAVDAYCETIAFSSPQIAKFFEKAKSLDIDVKLHADQLSDCGGAELAARFNALSADHLEYTTVTGVEALASSGTVAVLLPGPFLILGETQLPPIDELRSNSVPIAIATDCNPGSSPLCSIRLAMNLATSLFKLTPEECLAGVTRNAAQALGLLNDRGTLETGKRADLVEWNISHPRELTYWAGINQIHRLFINGELVD